jgi:hypothetical protein
MHVLMCLMLPSFAISWADHLGADSLQLLLNVWAAIRVYNG